MIDACRPVKKITVSSTGSGSRGTDGAITGSIRYVKYPKPNEDVVSEFLSANGLTLSPGFTQLHVNSLDDLDWSFFDPKVDLIQDCTDSVLQMH